MRKRHTDPYVQRHAARRYAISSTPLVPAPTPRAREDNQSANTHTRAQPWASVDISSRAILEAPVGCGLVEHGACIRKHCLPQPRVAAQLEQLPSIERLFCTTKSAQVSSYRRASVTTAQAPAIWIWHAAGSVATNTANSIHSIAGVFSTPWICPAPRRHGEPTLDEEH